MASLANQTISSTYDGLVKTSTDQPVGVSGVQLLEDGVGNSLALSVGRANQGVTVTGPLTGTLSATSVLADGVIATTQATSDNSTKVATTAYVKSVVTAEDLDIAGDSGTGAIDLDSQTLTIEGTANEIETSASGQTITIGLPSTITANVTGDVTGDLTGTVLTAAQTNITSVGTLSSLAVSGDVSIADKIIHTGDTNTAIRFPAADTVTVETGGTERVRVDAIGRVGVGLSPSASGELLQVSSANYRGLSLITTTIGNRPSITFLNLGANDSSYIQGDGRAIVFGAVNSDLGGHIERMRIDSSGNVGIGISFASAKLEVKETTAARAVRITGNANAQGAAQKNTIVRHYPVVSLGTKLIIPFVNQGGLNSTTIMKIWGHGAIFNSSIPKGFTATIALGHLGTISNEVLLESSGNVASISKSGMNLEVNFTSGYTAATGDGVFVTIEYMTNSTQRSIDVPNIAMN